MLENVRPGDLITADFMNGLINMFNELEHRVEVLESSTDTIQSVRITGFDPPEGQNLGQVLRIFGENFAWPSRNNTVTLQNFTVTSGGVATVREFRPGSSPQQLEFQLPATIAGIREGGTDITITVNSGEGTAQRTYRLLPALPTTGDPPAIASISHAAGGPNLTMGEEAIVVGENFSPTPNQNQITFIIPTPDGDGIRYPDPTVPERAEPITIIQATQTQIRFVVPNMAEVDFNGIDVSFELRVGNFPPLEEVVFVSS
jgi:hypothetical protein